MEESHSFTKLAARKRSKKKKLRGISRRALPAPAAAAAQRLRKIDDDDADADASDDMFHDTRYVPGPTSSTGDVGE